MAALHRIVRRAAPVLGAIAVLVGPVTLAGQSSSRVNGTWEPVSYPADLVLNDVFFVTPEMGWVTGGKYGSRSGGVLLHTRDGGVSWDAQIGDAESAEPPFTNLHFLDERHGWVLQSAGIGKYKLLRTMDAETWDQIGSIETEWGLLDYSFTSFTNGVYLDGNDNVARIMHTSDGGRTWTEAYKCPALQLQIEGLTKDITCTFKALHFPSAKAGYAVGGAHGAKRTLFIGKTNDGGKTWKTSTVSDIGGDLEVYFQQEVYFTDELTGFVHLSDKKLYRTIDGGRTWKGLIATPGPELRFADTQVGWSFFSSNSLSYTTDGGKRWTSREFAFPASVNAFSLPRRDRAYVVGEHGMIYRYRVVPAGQATAPKALAAPAMPVFDSPLDEQVSELDAVADALEASMATAPESVPAGEGALDSAGDEAAETSEVETEEGVDDTELEASQSSAFTAACCAKPLGKLDLVLTAVTGLIPEFLGQYKNTNLLLAGLRMVTDLPGRVNELNRALRAFRKAPDKAAAQSALAQVAVAIEGLSQSTAVAFQKQAPPAPIEREEPGSAGAAGVAVEEDAAASAESVEATPMDAAEEDQADATGEIPVEEEEPGSGPTAGGAPEGLAEEAARLAEEEAKKAAKESARKALKKKLRL